MDPRMVSLTDRKKADEDLAALLNAAAAAAPSEPGFAIIPGDSPTSPVPADPRLRNRKRPAPQQPSAKRVKLEDDSELIATPQSPAMRPSRLQLRQGPIGESPASPIESTTPRSPIEERKLLPQKTGATTAEPGSASPPCRSVDNIRNTLHNTVHRHWDSRRDEIGYEHLLENRRAERLTNVDRYVPDASRLSSHSEGAQQRKSTSFRFGDLPEKICKKISFLTSVHDWNSHFAHATQVLSLLLVQDGPIDIDFTWLRSFITGHCRVPSATKSIQDMTGVYSVPLDWRELRTQINLMQKDCSPFHEALEIRGDKTRKLKRPCWGLTTGLLHVSKAMYELAAPIFYSGNTWSFPCSTSAWIQLESFLATIGPTNVAHLRNINIHAPLWYRGVHEDYIEGTILDLTSPATRIGVVKPVARDRLLSAIEFCVHALVEAGHLENVSINLEHGMVTDRWTGRYHNDKQLMNLVDAEEHFNRKQEGIRLLRNLSSFADARKARPILSVTIRLLTRRLLSTTSTTFAVDLRESSRRLRNTVGRLTSTSRDGAGRHGTV